MSQPLFTMAEILESATRDLWGESTARTAEKAAKQPYEAAVRVYFVRDQAGLHLKGELLYHERLLNPVQHNGRYVDTLLVRGLRACRTEEGAVRLESPGLEYVGLVARVDWAPPALVREFVPESEARRLHEGAEAGWKLYFDRAVSELARRRVRQQKQQPANRV